MTTQVKPDGSLFEQSSYYHIYAVDFFLLHMLLHPVSADYKAGLRRMAEYAIKPSLRVHFNGLETRGRVPRMADF